MFIDLIINPDRQYQLRAEQQEMLTSAISTCPFDYRSLVHFTIVYANSKHPKSLYTLNEIIAKIKKYIIDDLKKEYKIDNFSILENRDDLKQWFSNHKIQNKIQKLTLCRNICTIIILENKPLNDYIDLILEFFSDFNSLETFQSVNLIQHKVKAIINFFKLYEPTTSEAERLLLYGSYSHQEIQQYKTKIVELELQITRFKESLQETRNICQEKNDKITQLQQELTQTKDDLDQIQTELEKEHQLYQQLDSTSQAKVSQEKNATINQIANRIEHELKKLERCFNSKNLEKFAENKAIGLKIIEKIKNQLLMEK